MKIFRKEAMRAQRVRLHGDVFLTQPVTMRLITLVIFLVVALCSLTLVFGSYARSENVSGHVVASNGLVEVRTPQFSILESIFLFLGKLYILPSESIT